MKKTYIAPSVEMAQAGIQQMLCLSFIDNEPAFPTGDEEGDALVNSDNAWGEEW